MSEVQCHDPGTEAHICKGHQVYDFGIALSQWNTHIHVSSRSILGPVPGHHRELDHDESEPNAQQAPVPNVICKKAMFKQGDRETCGSDTRPT
jgi:hypothetical protein